MAQSQATPIQGHSLGSAAAPPALRAPRGAAGAALGERAAEPKVGASTGAATFDRKESKGFVDIDER